MKVNVVFSIGSNCGSRETNVRDAIALLGSYLGNMAVSHIYETPDVRGGIGRYMNAVVSGITSMTEQDCELMCKKLELQAGRDAAARERGEVPLDVDIVVWDGDVLRPRDFRQKFFTIGFEEIQGGSFPL